MCKIPVCCCMWVNVSELCFASRSQGWDESCFAKIYYKNKIQHPTNVICGNQIFTPEPNNYFAKTQK